MAQNCAVVLPDRGAGAPTTVPAKAWPARRALRRSSSGCMPGDGTCGGVYPVSVALERQGSTAPLARFTTFLTYQEPGLSSSVGTGGALRVSLIVPHLRPFVPRRSRRPRGPSWRCRNKAWWACSTPTAVAVTSGGRPGTVSAGCSTAAASRASGPSGQLAEPDRRRDATSCSTSPTCPSTWPRSPGPDWPARSRRTAPAGTPSCAQAGLHPTPGTWVDTSLDFTSANADQPRPRPAGGGRRPMILGDDQLTPAHSVPANFAPLTYAQTLLPRPRPRGARRRRPAPDAQLDSLFTADPGRSRAGRQPDPGHARVPPLRRPLHAGRPRRRRRPPAFVAAVAPR